MGRRGPPATTRRASVTPMTKHRSNETMAKHAMAAALRLPWEIVTMGRRTATAATAGPHMPWPRNLKTVPSFMRSTVSALLRCSSVAKSSSVYIIAMVKTSCPVMRATVSTERRFPDMWMQEERRAYNCRSRGRTCERKSIFPPTPSHDRRRRSLARHAAARPPPAEQTRS